jgi:zinc protease
LIQLGTKKNNPDYCAIQVMNEILGGGFSSRLISNVRSKKGFAYEVGGGFGTDWDAPGEYVLFLSTQSEKTVGAIEALYEEIDLMNKNPGTVEEIKRAKDSILNSFIFRYQTKGQILTNQMNLEFYGYPSDFNEQFRAGIEKVAAADIAKVVNKYLKRNGFALLVVGKEKNFGRSLATFGEVKTIPIAIPLEPPSQQGDKPVTEGKSFSGNEDGKKLAAKVAEAMGGISRLNEVKAMRVKAMQNVKTPQGELQIESDTVFQFPNRKYIKAKTPMGELTTVFTSDLAFMTIAGKTQDFPSSRKDEMVKDNYRDSLVILQNLDNPKFLFTSTGKEKIGDADTVIVLIDADGTRTRWYVDPLTGHILRSSYQGISMSGPTERVVDYSDWKNFKGIILPVRHAAFDNGKEAGWMEILEVEFNPPIDAKIFEKPQ